MTKFFTTPIGRFRTIAFFEGISLLVLIFIGVPMKYWMHDPSLVKSIGPVHGILFLVYVLNAYTISADYQWKFSNTTWKILLASFVPFGTFYTDHTILKPLQTEG